MNIKQIEEIVFPQGWEGVSDRRGVIKYRRGYVVLVVRPKGLELTISYHGSNSKVVFYNGRVTRSEVVIESESFLHTAKLFAKPEDFSLLEEAYLEHAYEMAL
jgi:hypothetical protein